MIYQKKDFEQELQDNLELYTQDLPSHNLFSTHREISLARFALSQQAHSYAKAIEILLLILEAASEQAATNPKLFTDVMVAINAIENKSVALINSVRSVTELLGRAVNIDVDKASLSCMMLRLPSLVKETISQASGDTDLADKISGSLNSRITEMMVAFRFNPNSLQPHQDVQGITYDEYASLHDTIPQQPQMN